MFARDGPIVVNSTPGLQANNLTAVDEKIAFSRFTEIVVARSSSTEEPKKVQIPRSRICQGSYVNIGSSTYLVVVSDIGIQLWSSNGENLLSFISLSTLISEDGDHFLRGVTASDDFLAAGASTGDLFVFRTPNLSGETSVRYRLESFRGRAITALASSMLYLVCGNDFGDIFAYSTDEAFPQACQFPGRGMSCTGIQIADDVVIAGFSTGHIRIYRISINELSIEITAHARAVSGLSLAPGNKVFVSCSEDQMVQVWITPTFESPSSSSADLIYSDKLDNKMCTGVAFLSPDRFAVASFDDDNIIVFKRD